MDEILSSRDEQPLWILKHIFKMHLNRETGVCKMNHTLKNVLDRETGVCKTQKRTVDADGGRRTADNNK